MGSAGGGRWDRRGVPLRNLAGLHGAEQDMDDVGRSEIGVAVFAEAFDPAEVITQCDHARFRGAVAQALGHAHVGDQGVAEADATDGIGERASLGGKGGQGFGGATVAEGAIGPDIGFAEEAEVADALSSFVDVFLGERSFQEGDFERKAGRGGDGVGSNDGFAGEGLEDEGAADFGKEPGLHAESECGTDLDSGGALGEGFLEASVGAIAARQPEGEPEFAHGLQIDDIAWSVDRFTAIG